MEKKDFSKLMDQVIERKLLEGNSAQEPKKQVRIMVCADFEDSCIPEEKFFHWTPVPLDELPKFRLCAPEYWEKQNDFKDTMEAHGKGNFGASLMDLKAAKNALGKLFK